MKKADCGQPLDKRVTAKIRQLVLEDGMTVAADIKKVMEDFKKALPASSTSNLILLWMTFRVILLQH